MQAPPSSQYCFSVCSLRKLLSKFHFVVAGTAALIFFPFLDRLPGDMFNAKKVLSNFKLVEDEFVLPQIKSHWKTYSEGAATDYIHAYMGQMKQRQKEGKETSLDGRCQSLSSFLKLPLHDKIIWTSPVEHISSKDNFWTEKKKSDCLWLLAFFSYQFTEPALWCHTDVEQTWRVVALSLYTRWSDCNTNLRRSESLFGIEQASFRATELWLESFQGC